MRMHPLGPLVPRRGNILTRAIGRLLLSAYRWHVEGEVYNASKFVVVLAPHTSAWEFLTNIATMRAVGFRSYWLIADVYAWWPLSSFIRWLGGVPVDRSINHDLVSQLVRRFNESDELILTLYPEGTREKALKWRTGFWHIAVGARVPIQLVDINYEKRATVFGPVIEPSDDLEADMKKIQAHYRDVPTKHPDQFGGEYI